MILKSADDRTTDLKKLALLLSHPSATAPIRQAIEREIKNIRFGDQDRQKAANDLNLHYGSTPNWVVIHDLRIETANWVTEIDHLLINRFLDVWLCESGQYRGGISIDQAGACSSFFDGKLTSIASPIEQYRRHRDLVQSLMNDPAFPLPSPNDSWRGVAIKPQAHSAILIGVQARIGWPKGSVAGIESVLKLDQLRVRTEQDFDNKQALGPASLVSKEDLLAVGTFLVSLHCPRVPTLWKRKLGIRRKADFAEVAEAPT
jgi:Nuclease-related domain